MENNINDLVKIVEKNGQVLTHRDPTEGGVIHYHCSAFIKLLNVLVKGESGNKQKEKRNAMIVLFDLEKGNIVGN